MWIIANRIRRSLVDDLRSTIKSFVKLSPDCSTDKSTSRECPLNGENLSPGLKSCFIVFLDRGIKAESPTLPTYAGITRLIRNIEQNSRCYPYFHATLLTYFIAQRTYVREEDTNTYKHVHVDIVGYVLYDTQRERERERFRPFF